MVYDDDNGFDTLFGVECVFKLTERVPELFASVERLRIAALGSKRDMMSRAVDFGLGIRVTKKRANSIARTHNFSELSWLDPRAGSFIRATLMDSLSSIEG